MAGKKCLWNMSTITLQEGAIQLVLLTMKRELAVRNKAKKFNVKNGELYYMKKAKRDKAKLRLG